MLRSVRVRAAVAGLSCLLLASLAGCSEDTTKPKPVPPEVPRSTKMGLIAYFAQAHEDRDIDKYGECLHPDYVFWFSEDDRDDPGWDWHDWISKTEDLNVTEKMFTAEAVIDISLSLVNMTQVEGAETAEDRFWESPVYVEEVPIVVYWAEFAVDMHVVENAQEEAIDHWVDGRANIYLLPDPVIEGRWTIWKIEDRGNVHWKATDKTSWSSVKALYRK